MTDTRANPPGTDSRARERMYLALLVAGIAVPYWSAVPWFVKHGVDAPRFLREVFSTRLSRFFGYDVAITVGTLLALAAADDELPGLQRVAVAGGALSGASVGLPLYLYLLERHRRLTR